MYKKRYAPWCLTTLEFVIGCQFKGERQRETEKNRKWVKNKFGEDSIMWLYSDSPQFGLMTDFS